MCRRQAGSKGLKLLSKEGESHQYSSPEIIPFRRRNLEFLLKRLLAVWQWCRILLLLVVVRWLLRVGLLSSVVIVTGQAAGALLLVVHSLGSSSSSG